MTNSITDLLNRGLLSPKRGKLRPKSAPGGRKLTEIPFNDGFESRHRVSTACLNKLVRKSSKGEVLNKPLHDTAVFANKIQVRLCVSAAKMILYRCLPSNHHHINIEMGRSKYVQRNGCKTGDSENGRRRV